MFFVATAPGKDGSLLPYPTHFLITLSLLSALLTLTATAGSARARPRIESEGNAVVVNKRVALKFAARNGNAPPMQRAQAVADRLQAQAARGLSPREVRPSRDGKQWRVVIAGRTSLLSVTPADGHVNGSHPKALANRWAAQIRQALAVPPVSLRPGRLVIPLGETRVLKYDGYAEGEGAARIVQDAPTLQLLSPPGSRHLTVRAEKTGKAIVRVKVGQDEAACVVEVKKWAGRVPKELIAEVTGTPAAPPDLVVSAASALLRHVPCEPGATLRVQTPLKASRALAPGKSQTLTARVLLQGRGYLTSAGLARIRVVNRALPARPAARLFYSNSPEHITRPTTLYAATLTDEAPARVMFHHDNQMRGATVLSVTVSNLSDNEVRLHLLPGFVEQAGDPARVGYRAGQVFLKNLMKHRGEVFLLPAHTTLPLVLQRLDRHQTASGIAQVRLLNPPSDARCRVEVKAVAPSRVGFSSQARNRLDPWRYTAPRPMNPSELAACAAETGPQTVYTPKRTLEAHYIVGERWVFMPLGRDGAHSPDTDADPKHADISGDYGVLYNIRITIQNPHPTSQKVSVIFAPGGGAAMAVFTIGGRYLAVNETKPPHQHLLAQYTLRPRETRVVTLQTVPLGGSSYPANVIVR
jgi:hypothetical protein